METVGHFIDGSRIAGGSANAPITDPSTGKVTKQVALGSKADVDKAVAAAAAAFPAWAATPAPRRAAPCSAGLRWWSLPAASRIC